jgi:hypothetical protein
MQIDNMKNPILLFIGLICLNINFAGAQNNKWEVAEKNIKRLLPESFPQLPQNIKSYLNKNDFTIPQSYLSEKPHNVIHGEFKMKGIKDWAVLASKNGISTIIVFWGGSDTNFTEIAKESDTNNLQGIGENKIAFSRYIGIVEKQEIWKYYKEFGGVRPPKIKHQGIADCIDEKASVILYFYKEKFIELQGAD